MAHDTPLDAWCKGYAAARDGQPASASPYADGDPLASAWGRGWAKALAQAELHWTYGATQPALRTPGRVLQQGG